MFEYLALAASSSFSSLLPSMLA